MTFKELKNKRINETRKLLVDVKEIIDQYAEEIAKLNIKILKADNLDWITSVDDYLDIIYNSLENVYSITLEKIREIYSIEILNEEITQKNINKLTYSKDGLTLRQRIIKHCEEYEKDKPTKERLLYDMIKILNTEALCVMNNLISNKVNFEYAAIDNDGECCELCSDYANEEYIPIDDFEEPPYHPNCECIAVYFTAKEIKK